MKKKTNTIKEPSPVYHVEHQNGASIFNGDAATAPDIGDANRKERLRHFVYSHLSVDLAQQLEAEDFLIGKPMPNQFKSGELESRLLEAEASGYLSEEETKNMFRAWQYAE